LQFVAAVKVVTTKDAAGAARDGILVRVVVGWPIRASGDLVVDHPIAAHVAMSAESTFGGRGSFVVLR
jgi:hypothetical protein